MIQQDDGKYFQVCWWWKKVSITTVYRYDSDIVPINELLFFDIVLHTHSISETINSKSTSWLLLFRVHFSGIIRVLQLLCIQNICQQWHFCLINPIQTGLLRTVWIGLNVPLHHMKTNELQYKIITSDLILCRSLLGHIVHDKSKTICEEGFCKN